LHRQARPAALREQLMEAMLQLTRPIERAGGAVLRLVAETGSVVEFFLIAFFGGFRAPVRWRLILAQMEFVGVGSMFIVLLTGSFTGAVFTLQSVNALQRVGMESMVGSSVMLAVTRELAPVLTSLMVTGRVGSAMATELGTMRVTEQIDAMEVMAIDPIRYLIFPRLVAGALMVPCLTIIFDLVALVGSYTVAILFLGLDEGAYVERIRWFLDPYDITHGVYKAIAFGIVLTLVGCYKGYNANGGARGVGIATTQAVVIGSIAIFILDYVLTTILLVGSPETQS
jgi:phospholipid/cholesterol/gamma-HCH transport system permease protein